MHWRFLCLSRTFEPCRSSAGISPSCPAPNFPEIPAARKELGLHCRDDLVLSCRICTPGGETELLRVGPTSPHPHIHVPNPTLQPGTIPPPGKGNSLLHSLRFLFCCIQSSEQNKQILDFIAKALLPSGLALSLQVGLACPSIKTPTTHPKVFSKPPKHPFFSLFSPKSPYEDVFKE